MPKLFHLSAASEAQQGAGITPSQVWTITHGAGAGSWPAPGILLLSQVRVKPKQVCLYLTERPDKYPQIRRLGSAQGGAKCVGPVGIGLGVEE